MAISVSIEINRDFDVNADFDRVFDLLANVPESASFFPKVDRLIPLENGAYRWEMQKMGVDKHSLQTVYACTYKADRERGQIEWAPIKGVGNGSVSGSWKVERNGSGTRLRFHTQGTLELPLPGLLKLAVSPVVKHEFNALVDTYIQNLQRHFG